MKIEDFDLKLEDMLRIDLAAFIEWSFALLNPETPFMYSWYIEVLAYYLELCRTGKIKRLIINLPPRMLKSHSVSVAFIAYLLGHNPFAEIIAASYVQDLSEDLAGKCRKLMMSDEYRKVFPETILAPGRLALHDFHTTVGGCRMATSVGGPLTGRGADLITLDDPLKPEDAISDAARNRANNWISNTVMSRFNDKRNGCMIIVMQRLHEDDITGHLLQKGGWTLLKLPAIAEQDERFEVTTPYGNTKVFRRKKGEALHPERESIEMLRQTEREIGRYNFEGQYQQNAAPLDGGIVRRAWFKRYTKEEMPARFETIFQSWDTANKASELNCYSVCTTFGVYEKRLYLLDVRRVRMEFPELCRFIKEHARDWGAETVVIEDKASGTQLLQQLKRDGLHSVLGYETPMEKANRLISVSSIIANGFMLIPSEAPWIDEYLHELLTFPNGRYVDQVDSTTQALDWWRQGLGASWISAMAREYSQSHGESGEAEELSTAVPSPTEDPYYKACPKCGNPNLGLAGVPGHAGDKEQSCTCGWARTVRVAVKERQTPKVPCFSFKDQF